MMQSRWILLFSLSIFCVACHESKYLAEGEQLYAGNVIRVRSSVPLPSGGEKEIRSELTGLLRPRLNGKILGGRFKLWVYNVMGHPKRKGLRYWIKNKIGEPPVLASNGILEKNRGVMQNRMENKGYFRDTVILENQVTDKKLTAVYTAQIGPRYTIRNIIYPKDTDTLSRQIDSLQRRSLLKKGAFYDLDVIKDERTRIDSRLKQRGYYYFNPNYLFADIDSSVGGNQVDMYMKIKDETPPKARQAYHINDVVVFAQYLTHSDTSLSKAFITPEGYKVIDSPRMFNSVIYSRTLVFKPGDLYRQNDHNLSLSRLVSLGVFRFVRAHFDPIDTTGAGKLNAFYYLTPSKRKSIRFEASALTRSDNTTGGELSLSWRHRNFFRGAELFSVAAYGGLEQQNTGGGVVVSTQRLGAGVSLLIPRIISPFKWTGGSAFVPKTKISAGYELYNRTSQYTLNSAKVDFGYIFKYKATAEHQLTILGVNYVRPTNIAPSYQLALDTNITLARSIERQLILGSTYNFNYNSQARPNNRRNNFYFNGNVDFSGNIAGWLTGANIDKGKQVNIFHIPFSQYVRLEADFRHYLSFSRYNTFVTRVTGGIGYSYGNSSTMPFVKEFFAGGTNDIRAFRSRAVGPGSFYGGDPKTTPNLPDQPGDIKLEANAEYRMKLFSILRWALFADAGNVWTIRADTSRPGSTFTASFLKDVAVGIGTGFRFDLTILVLRFDMAVPVRYPWLPAGAQWNFKNAGEIKNWVLNIAIGYPF